MKHLKSFFPSSIFTLLLGILLVVSPTQISNLVCFIFGGILIVFGILQIISLYSSGMALIFNYPLILGIVFAVAGFIIVINPNFIISFIPLVIGVSILIHSVFKLISILHFKKYHSLLWWLSIIVSFAMIVLSLYLIGNAFSVAKLFLRLLGLFLIVNSFFDIFGIKYISKKLPPSDKFKNNDIEQ